MGNIFYAASHEIIDGDNPVLAGQQQIHQVGAQETRSAGDHRDGLLKALNLLFWCCHPSLDTGSGSAKQSGNLSDLSEFSLAIDEKKRQSQLVQNMSATLAMLALLGDAAELLSASRDNNLMTILLILLLSIA